MRDAAELMALMLERQLQQLVGRSDTRVIEAVAQEIKQLRLLAAVEGVS